MDDRAAIDRAGPRSRSSGKAIKRARASKRGLVRSLVRSVVLEFTPAYRLRPTRSRMSPFIKDSAGLTPVTSTPVVWRRVAGQRLEWHIYHQTAAPVVNWRDRWAFSPARVEHRTPFNDLRVVELMASMPEAVKQFPGRRKDILREAEYEELPREIPNRSDFGLYTELLDAGMTLECEGRVATALDAISQHDIVHAAFTKEEVQCWVKLHHTWWEHNWNIITAGLWLAYSRVQHQPPSMPLVLQHGNNMGREVIA